MKNRAFKIYISALPLDEGVSHIWTCIRTGDHPNMAWELMDELIGPSWMRVDPNPLDTIQKAIVSLKQQMGRIS